MKRLFATAMILFLLITIPCISCAGEDQKKEAENMVAKAVQYIVEVGKDKAFAEFNNKAGNFTTDNLYVFVLDLNGVVRAHGQFPEWTGKSKTEINNPNQTAAVNDILELIKKSDKGWASYDYWNPRTGKIEPKQSYVERIDGIIVGCGIYAK